MLNTVRFIADDKMDLLEQICNYERYGVDDYWVNDALEDLTYVDEALTMVSNEDNLLIVALPQLYATVKIQYDNDEYVMAIGYSYGW